jgi:hypothetical protein
MAVVDMKLAESISFFKNNAEYDCANDAEAKEHFYLVFGVKPGCGHGLRPIQKGLKYSDVLGSNRRETACRQDAITNAHATPHKKLMGAHAKKPSRKLRKLLAVYNPGDKSCLLILGAIGVASGLTDSDRDLLVGGGLEGTNGFKGTAESQIS